MIFSRDRIGMAVQAVFWTAFIVVLPPHLPPIDPAPGPSLESLGAITGHADHPSQ
jgi:hypothetical protein